MFEFPSSLPLWVLFGGLFLTLITPHVCLKNSPRIQWWIVLSTLLLSLVAAGVMGLAVGPRNTVPGIFIFEPMNVYLSVCVLLFGLLNHLNFDLRPEATSEELAPLELVTVASAYMIVLADHFFVFVLLTPLLILILSVAPEINSRDRGRGSIFVGLCRATVILILVTLGGALLYGATGVLRLSEVAAVVVQPGKNIVFWMGWVMLSAAFGTLFLCPPWQFFLKDYEAANSWSIWGFFNMYGALIGAGLVSKMLVLVQSENMLSRLHFTVGAQNLPHVGLMLFLIFGTWSAVLIFLTKRALNFVYMWQIQPILLLLLGVGVRDVSALTWGMISLMIFVFAVPITARLFNELNVSLDLRRAEFSAKLGAASSRLKICLFICFLLLSPLATTAGFELLTESITILSKTAIHGAELGESAYYAVGSIVVVFLMTSANIMFISNFFGSGAQHKPRDQEQSLRSLCFDYIPFVPFIILGIYPAPLYNYVIMAMKLLN